MNCPECEHQMMHAGQDHGRQLYRCQTDGCVEGWMWEDEI